DFGGSLDHLREARAAVSIPAIAKDFTVFPEQVAAQRLAGADAILVILAMVSDDEARRLMETAALLGMDALVETHSREEIDRAVAIGARVVGVNARDLETLEIDRDRQLELLSSLPRDVIRVAESGIAAREDVERARDAGADAVLVGTALMRDPLLLAELVGVPRDPTDLDQRLSHAAAPPAPAAAAGRASAPFPPAPRQRRRHAPAPRLPERRCPIRQHGSRRAAATTAAPAGGLGRFRAFPGRGRSRPPRARRSQRRDRSPRASASPPARPCRAAPPSPS